MTTSTSWFFWAALSAVFAALTAIFAKIGIQGVDSDLATLVRTEGWSRDSERAVRWKSCSVGRG
jgi:hypothetical protein